MELGDFQDFLETVTPEVVGQITHDANEKAAQIRMLSRPGEPDFFWKSVCGSKFDICT